MATFRTLVTAGTVELAPCMLEPADKEEWAASGFAFDLLDLQLATDDAGGSYWSHLIDMDGTKYTFRLQTHPARDATARALMAALADGPVERVKMQAQKGKNGNSFILLSPAD